MMFRRDIHRIAADFSNSSEIEGRDLPLFPW